MGKINLNPYRNKLSIDGLVLKHDAWLDQPLLVNSNVTFGSLSCGDLTANGTIFLTGTVTEVETQRMVVGDSFIELNDGHTTLQSGGMKINRGTGIDPFQLIYTESDRTCRIGSVNSLLPVTMFSLQPIATREETPTDGYLAIWNAATRRFITTNTFSGPFIFEGTVTMLSTLTFGNNVNSPFIDSDNSNNLLLNSNSNLILNAINGNIVVPIGSTFVFETSNTPITLIQNSGQLNITGSFNFNQTSSILWGGFAQINSTNSGNDLNLYGNDINILANTSVNISTVPMYHGISTFSTLVGNIYQISSTGDLILVPGNSHHVHIANLVLDSGGISDVDFTVTVNGALSINVPNDLTLNPLQNVIVNTGKWLCFGSTSNNIRINNNDLYVTSSSGIVLSAASQVYIPVSIPLNLATGTSVYEQGDGTAVFSSNSHNILLSPGNTSSVLIPVYVPLVFGVTEHIHSDSVNMIIETQGLINLVTPLGVNISQNIPLLFGDTNHKIYQDNSNNVVIRSNHQIILNATEQIQLTCSFLGIGTCSIYQDISGDNSLTFTSNNAASYIKSVQDILVTTTTVATFLGNGSIKTLGGVYIGNNLHVSTDANILGTLAIGNAITLSDSIIPMNICNSSNVTGTVLEMTTTWDITSGFTFGRGNLTSAFGYGRSMVFTIPSYSVYGVGIHPSFIFSASNGVNYLVISDTSTEIIGNLISGGNGTFSGTVSGTGFTLTDGSFMVNSGQVNINSGLTVKNSLNVTDSLGNPLFGVSTMQNIICNVASFFDADATFNGNINATNSSSSFGTTTFHGNVSLNGNRIYNAPTPIYDTDLTTKLYVDSVAVSRTDKQAVLAASTADISDLTAQLYQLDSITVVPGDRILIKNQNIPVDNGIYVLDNSSVPQRAPDMLTGTNASGSSVFVISGATNSSVGYVVIGSPVIVDTDSIVWTPFSGAATINVTSGILKSGNTLYANVDNISVSINGSSEIQIDPNFIGTGLSIISQHLVTSSNQSNVTQLGTITSGIWNANTIDVSFGGTGRGSFGVGNVLIGNGTSNINSSNNLYWNGNSLGINTNSPSSYCNIANVPGTFTGTLLTIQDSDTLISQSSGISIVNNNYSSTYLLGYTGNTTIATSSKFIVNTNTIDRFIVDDSGNVMIGTNVPLSIFTVQGQATISDIVTNSLLISNVATIQPNLGNTGLVLTTGSLQLTGNLFILGYTVLGNFNFNSSNSYSVLTSKNPNNNLGIPIKVDIGNVTSMIVSSNGLVIPNTLQIGGNETDSTTGFSLGIMNNNLQINPGMVGKSVIFTGPTMMYSGITFIDNNLLSSNFNLTQSLSQLILSSNLGNNTFLVENCIVSLNDDIIYNPNGIINYSNGLFSISGGIKTLFNDDLYLNNSLRYIGNNSMETVLVENGWYYIGIVNNGITSIQSIDSWIISLSFDGSIITIKSFTVFDRSKITLVIYLYNNVYYMFVNVTSSPVQFKIIESSTNVFLSYEGSGGVPSGINSGFINSWVLDYTTNTAIGSGTTEFGNVMIDVSASIQNATLSGTTNISGQLNGNNLNTEITGSQFIWNSSVTNALLAEFSTSISENSLTISSNDLASPALYFEKISAQGSLKMLSVGSIEYANSLVLSQDTNDSMSQIVFQTRAIPRVLIDSSGNLNVLSTTDDSSNITGALIVSGSATFGNRLYVTTCVETSLIKVNNTAFNTNFQLTCNSDGSIDIGNTRVTNAANPIDPSDLVTMSYVHSVLSGLNPKESVVAVSIGVNIDLTVVLSVLDGISLVQPNRVLLKDQNNPIENGIYIIQSSSPPIRSDDMALGSSIAGDFVFVEQGVVNSGSGWVSSCIIGQDLVGVNNLTFTQFSGASAIIAGNGIQKAGNMISAKIDNISIQFSGSGQLQISSGALGQGLIGGSGIPISVNDISFLDTLGTITTGVWNGSIVSVPYGGTGNSEFSIGSIVYSNGTILTESSGFYFDASNIRLGINTNSPTSGFTVVDRDIQLTQAGSNALYLLFTSSSESYGIRNDNSGSLIFSSGISTNKYALSDIALFNTTGLFTVYEGISAGYLGVLNEFNITSSTIEKVTIGAMSLDFLSLDNTGSYIRFFGGLGTPGNTTNSELLVAGYYNGEYTIKTIASGTGSSRSLVLETFGNSQQFYLATDGSCTFSGIVNIQDTIDSTSINSGSLVVSGGLGVSGTTYLNNVNVVNNLNISGSLSTNELGLTGYLLNTNISGNLNLSNTTSGTNFILEYHTFNSVNTLNTLMYLYGYGSTFNTGNSEWLSIGFETSNTVYALRTGSIGSTFNRNLVFSTVNGLDQLVLSPDNTFTINTASMVCNSTGITFTSTVDANSTLYGSVVFSGGVAIGKSLYVGSAVNSNIYQVTNMIQYSNGVSIDQVYSSYSSMGNLNFFNNSNTSLNIHFGNSGGPNSANQEKLVIGYKDTNTVSISSLITGSGYARDLALETMYYPNQIVLSCTTGIVTFNSSILVNNTSNAVSFSSASFTTLGGVAVSQNLLVGTTIEVGTGNTGTLLRFNGYNCIWEFNSANSNELRFQPFSSDAIFSIANANSIDLLKIDTNTSSITSTCNITTTTNNTRTLVLQNASQADMFVFDTVNQVFDVKGGTITGLASPQYPLDGVNKNYVDNIAIGLNYKQNVIISSTININVLAPVLTLDGVSLSVGYRVLIMNQTNQVENGIYIVQSGYYLIRSSDLANGSRAAGSFVYVQLGNTNGNSSFVCITNYPADIVGSNSLFFTQFGGGFHMSSSILGNGLDVTNTGLLEINLAYNSGLSFFVGALKIDQSIAGYGLSYTAGVLSLNPITTVSTVTVGTWNASTITVPYGGTGNTAFTNKSMIFSNGTILEGTSGLSWDSITSSLGMNGTPNPNSNNDGITLYDKDVFLESVSTNSSLLYGDSLGNYNWRIRRDTAGSSRSVLPIDSFNFIAMSNNGNIGIITCDPSRPVYITTSFGNVWYTIPQFNTVDFAWGEPSLSQDGTYMLLLDQQGYLYVSQNAGTSWTTRVTDFVRFWEWSSMSNTGMYMLASSLDDGVYSSQNYGSTWTHILSTEFSDVAFVYVSFDGSTQFVGYIPNGVLVVSYDNGNTWNNNSIRTGNWYDIVQSTGSNYMILYEYPGSLFISSDAGVSFTETMALNNNWISAAVSSNGSVQVAVVENGLIYLSTDYGATFNTTLDATSRYYSFVLLNSTGSTIYAGGYNIPVFISSNTGVSWTTLTSGNVTVKGAALSNGNLIYPEYNSKINLYSSVPSSNLVISTGSSTIKSSLTDYIVFTDSQLIGVGFQNSQSGNISATLDISGTFHVSENMTLDIPLSVTSGGSGTNSLDYGILICNGGTNPFTSTGTLVSGAIPIGSLDNSGSIVLESGATLRSHIGLGIGTDVQSYSTILDNLSTLVPTLGYFITGNGSSFVTSNSVTVKSLLGLGALASLNTINNSYFSGTQLSVVNGGTGSISFTNSSFPFFNGSILTSSILFYDQINTGIAINASSVIQSAQLLVYSGDIAIQPSNNNNPISLLFANSNSDAAWRIRRQEDGLVSGNSNLIFSGGIHNSSKTSLIDQFQIASSGTVSVFSTIDSTSIGSGALIVSGGVAVQKSLFVGNTITIQGTTNSVSVGTGSLVLSNGGLSVASNIYLGGNLVNSCTTDSSSLVTGSIQLSGGLAIKKTLFSTGKIILQTASTISSTVAGLTIGVDASSFITNTTISNSNRSLLLVNNASSGAVVLSMLNTTSTYGWDIITEGSGNNRLIFQTNGSTCTNFLTLDAVTGTLTLNSSNDSTYGTSAALSVSGGVYIQKSLQVLTGITAGNSCTITNSTSSNASTLSFTADTGLGASLYLNGSTNTTNGIANSMTLVNHNGILRLEGSGNLGITINTSGQVAIDSTVDSSSSTTGSLVIPGGLGISKSVNIQTNLTVNGTLSVPSLTSTPTVTTNAGDFTNISAITVYSTQSTVVNSTCTLNVTFKVTPTSSSTNTLFTFNLVNKTSNLSDRLDVFCNTLGYYDTVNLNQISVLGTGVSGTQKVVVKFTSGSTGLHYITITTVYSSL
jgi:hypothetical protein